ncbi:MAG: response regulator [Candidatus Rokubacteria bacterium]|nr:response regulator [Candidatus Rokubacteria bacterium]
MTGDEGPLGDIRDTLAQITRRLDELSARVGRLAPGAGPAPVGEPLGEAARRAVADLESLLAVGPDLDRGTALLLAVDRVVHRAAADCAAVYLPTAEGDLDAAAHRGFTTPPLRVRPPAGLVGRAFLEGETMQAGPAHRGADPLLAQHGLEQALGVPVRRAGGPALGVLLAGRRRPVAFEPAALEVLHLLADRLSLVLGAVGAGTAGEAERPGDDLDLEATAARVAREAARRLGAPRVAILLPDPGPTRVAALVGIPVDTTAPALEGEPLATVRAGGGPWIAPDEAGPEALARFLGAPPRLVAPLVADGQTVALLVAGGPRPLSTAALEPMLAPAARAIRNARLHGETLAALAERRAWERRAPPPPPPARDFAGLLAVLLARVGLVRERVRDPALAADLAVAEEAAWRAAEAVRDLLGFAPGSRGGELRPLDLGAVIRAAVDETRHRWAAGGGTGPVIEMALDPLPPVRGSADDLQEALEQLLANAGEATPAGASVRVRARWDGSGRVEVAVEDAGSGMAEAVRARALDPFFSTKGPGRLGLGLPVAQAILGRHRGSLELETAAGRGTTVRLTLPTAARARQGEPGPDPTRAPARVLVIEDETAVREALVALLEQHGHVATGVADGDAGLAVVQREAPDVVVTDLALPAGSGLDLAAAVKRIRPGTPVILVTAWPGRLDAAAVAERGVDRVIEKPVGGAQLFGALDAVLGRPREAPA